MVRGVVRGSMYLPASSDGRRRLRAPDEDAFTMVATALELLLPGASPQGPISVRAYGAARDVRAELLAGIFGAPVVLIAVARDRIDPPHADVLEARNGPSWIVGAFLDGTDPAAEARSPPGEGAFALMVDDLPAGTPSLFPVDSSLPPGEELAYLQQFVRKADRGQGSRWVGDVSADPTVGPAPPAHRPGSAPPPVRVSEGAYVPLPTYLEGVASRWRFVGDRCAACGGLTFPGRGRCRSCGRSDQLSPAPLPRDGLRAEAVTWIGPGGQPTEFDDQVAETGAYGVVLAELAPGVRATLQLTETAPGSVAIGDRLNTRLRRLYAIDGAWRYGRKALKA